MKVLIVDDEEGIRESLRDAFEDEGYKVAVAANGLEAMEQLSTPVRPCVVILDILMPGMDGNEVLTAMRSDAQLSEIPVVVTTSDPSLVPKGVLTMRKPVDLSVLMDTVDMFCRRKQATAQAR